jgi:hypothetical protein
VRTTVDIEAPLLKKLRAEAQRRGVSFKDLLQGLIRRGLQDLPAKRATYRVPVRSLGTPDQHIRLDKALALASALEDDEIVRELRLRK